MFSHKVAYGLFPEYSLIPPPPPPSLQNKVGKLLTAAVKSSYVIYFVIINRFSFHISPNNTLCTFLMHTYADVCTHSLLKGLLTPQKM